MIEIAAIPTARQNVTDILRIVVISNSPWSSRTLRAATDRSGGWRRKVIFEPTLHRTRLRAPATLPA